MANEFRIFIALSLCVHAGVFLAFSLKAKRSPYIVLPVELMFYRPLSAPASAAPQTTAPAPVSPGEKEIVLPRKEKKAKKDARKETPREPVKQKEESKSPAGAESTAQSSSPSSPLSVDAARFPYAYYTSLVVKKIGRSWQWSTEYGKLKAVVYFKIMRSGEIGEVKVKEASGDRLFDEQAVRAISLASPFPPLPSGYSGDDLGVYFEFTYRE
ncbi:MAG: energy transducer TonB [Endomicrobiales bacterium]